MKLIKKLLRYIIHMIESFKVKMPSNCDVSIHISVLILMVFGSIMIFSVSVGDTIINELFVVKTVFKQSLLVVLSYLVITNLANNFKINSLYAFASGGWKGLGLGQSIQKLKYLPAASTDYILAIVQKN